MTDPLLASKADLQDFTRTTVEDDQALLLLAACSDAARDWTGQFISPVAGDIVTLLGNGKEDITLPEWPVTDVAEVLELSPGQAIGDGTVLVVDEDYSVSTAGVLHRTDGAAWADGFRYQVTYDHGWDPIKPSTILAVCKMAAQVLSNPTASGPMQSETIGDYSYTLAAAGAVRQMTDAQALLAPLRSPKVA